ncbi:MAG: hypothetical protein J6C56_04805 [Alistipes sp.]|nr:hypothetical protein [Alistipes sp.]
MAKKDLLQRAAEISAQNTQSKPQGVGVNTENDLLKRAEQISAEQAERAEQMARMQLEQDLSGMVTRGMQRGLHTTMGQAYSAPRALDNIIPATPAEAAVARSVDNARMEGLYKVEEERLKPLMDYLEAAELPEGYTAPNGQNIPHGEALIDLVGANAGVTDTGPLYTNTNRLRAMYMLDPELAKGSTQVPWNEKYPQPTAPIMTPAEDGLYHIGDNTYTRDDMINVLAGYIPSAQHERLLKRNKYYRDDYARTLGYKNWDDAYNRRMESLLDDLDYIEGLIKEETNRLSDEYIEEHGRPYSSKATSDYYTATKAGNAADAIIVVHNARDYIRSLINNDFKSGFFENFDPYTMASLGIVDSHYIISRAIRNKQEQEERNGLAEPITDYIVGAWGVMEEANAIQKEMLRPERSFWNKVGGGVGTSVEILPQFALGMGLTGGIGSGVNLGGQTLSQFFKNSSKRAIGSYIGKKAGIYAARSAVAAPATPMMWSNYVQRRNQQFSLDADGNLVKEEKPWAKDLGIAYVETLNEYFSEYLGYGASRLIDVSPTVIGRVVGFDKWAGKLGLDNAMTYVRAFTPSPKTRAIWRNMGFSGAITEAPSEILGDFMSSLMLAPFSEEHGFKQFADPQYWKEMYLTTAIFGGAMSLPSLPGQVKAAYDTNKNIKARDAAMGRIQDEELRNNLKSVMSLDSIEEMSQAMVDLHIGDLSPDQAAAALEYVSNATLVKVATGEMMEDQRMAQMAGLTNILPKLTYKGKDGSLTTDELIEVTDKKGRKLYVVAGDVNNTSDTSMLKCATFDSEGNVVTESLLASEVIGINRSTMDAQWVGAYERIFGAELAVGRLQEIEGARRSMENPSGEVVRAHYLRNGLKVYNTGEEVTLVDGRTATVETLLDNGHYLVRSMNPETQQEEMVDIPFMQVLQPENAMAEAQKKMYADSLNKVAEDIVEEEVTEQSEGMQEEAEEQIDAIEEQIEEMPQQVPTREDGKVDYNAIDDPKLYAAQFAKDMGDEATAKKRVGVMAQQARAQAEKLRAKSETLTDANEIIDTNAKADALEAKADFYDKVAAEYTAKEKKSKEEVFKSGDAVEYEGRIAEVVAPEGNDVMIRDARGNYMVVPPAALTRVAEMSTTEVEPEMQEDESLIVETESGLVQNVFGKLLDKRTARIIDAMAKALGLKVVFVERVRTQAGTFANADIQGNVVRMSWSQRGKAIPFLAGHEFLHRMKNMSEEAYNEFKQSVIENLGEEEWKRRVDAMRANYEAHNAIAQRTGKPLLTYDDALLEEEIVADFAGYLVHTHHAFDIYLQRQEQQKTQKFNLFRWLRDVFAYLRDWYKRLGARTEAQRMKEMVDKLNETIDRAIADAKKNGVNLSNEQKYSISATEMAEIEAERRSIIETAKANGTYLKAPNGKDTNLTPEQWVNVRTKAFKEWFGDWEKAARIEKLRNSENVFISGNEIAPSDDMKKYRKNALEYGKTIRGEYVNTDTGSSIVINKDSLTEVLHHDGSNIAHIQSIAAIPQMVESGIYITSEPVSETASKKLRNAKMAHYYVCGLNIGDVPYTVKFVVAEFESGEKYYDHSLTEIEKGELLNRAELSSTVAESKTPISDVKDKRLISILQTNSSKIVDENGEPKEVFHGTPNDFYVFGEDVSSKRPWTYEDTFYFTDSEKNAKTYGGRIVGAFLNIRNPYVYDFEGRSWRNLKFDIAVTYGRDNSILASGFATKEEAQAWLENFKKENPEHYAVKDENGRYLIVNENTITGQAGLTTDEQTQTAKAEGYDGNIQKNISDTAGGEWVVGEDGVAREVVDPEVLKPRTNYVVYDSRQIKSSTENVGTYDATNPDIRYSLSQPIFYSNADYAVRGIKQEKATPEQWLKMIEKNGGLKAGEDKWLGLSDWLKASDKKTLTKDEVLQYIAENDIQIEEVSYGAVADISREEIYESAEFAELRESLTEYDEDDNPYINRERYDELRSESYDFVDGFSLDYWGEELEVNSPAAAATYLGLTNADKEINETRLGYTTQGLTNKREIALVVPTIEPWNTSDNIHFGDAGEGRAVAWIRFGETTDADGKRVLVIDEIQSKRHQAGREEGYRDEATYKKEKAKLDELEVELMQRRKQLIQRLNDKYGSFDNYLKSETRGWRTGLYPNEEVMTPEEIAEYNATDLESNTIPMARQLREKYLEGIPSAPFEKNWAELAMKRMLRYAAENGFDKVAWTTGDQQADRYNMSNYFNSIKRFDIESMPGRRFELIGSSSIGVNVDEEGKIISSSMSELEGKPLADVVGKEMAVKMMQMENNTSLEDADLKIGGSGMKAFYDQMLPSFVRKYAKKWGATVGEVTMPDLEENNTMHSVDVTPAMRESVMQGQPKFSLSEVNARFNEELATLTEENKDKVNLSLGMPSDILLAAGVVNKPMKLYGAKVIKKQKTHGFKLSELENLPMAVAYPIAVFNNYQKDDNRSVLTELTTDDGNFLVSLNVGKDQDIDFNIVATVFGKGSEKIVDWINKGYATYIDKEKALNYLHHSAPIAEALSNPRLISTTKVIQNFENPKIEPRFSLQDAETEKIFAAAKEKFGTTYDMREAGWILPDGSMLDFSGRHQVRGGDTSFLNGDRTVDHREIADIAYDFDENETGVETDMGDFLDRGAIRIDSNAGAINLNVAPTKAQKDRLKRLIERNDGYVYIDFGKGWDTEHYAEYEAARASRVLGDIDRYFDEGIKPTGNVRFSLSSVEDEKFQRKTAFLTDLMREYNIPLPTFIAQTSDEFLSMVKDYFKLTDDEVKKYEDRIKAMDGTYVPEDDIILMNGGVIRYKEQMSGCVRHEFAHYNSKYYLFDEIRMLANSFSEDVLKKVQEEYLKNYTFEELGKEGVINEIISYLSEEPTMQEIIAIFEGRLAIDEYIEKLQDLIEQREDIKQKEVYIATLPLVKKNIELQKQQYGEEKGRIIVIPRPNTIRQNVSTYARGSSSSYTDGNSKAQPRSAEADRRGESANAQEVDYRHSLEEIINTPSDEEHKTQMLELAQQMERDAESTAVRRWLESKAAVRKTRTRKMYDDLIKEQKKVVSEMEAESKGKRTNKNYGKAVDAILQGQAHESLPIEDQILVDIALGQKLRWEDEKDGKRRGLKSKLGLRSAKAEGMRGVTGGNTYVEDYVAAVMERNNGYENDIDDNDVRNAVIEVFGAYPSRKAALEELSRRYPDTAINEATEALDRLEYERNEALAQIDADLREELADAEANPAKYERVYEEESSWNAQFDIYTGALQKARNELSRAQRDMERVKLTQREKAAAMNAVRSAITEMLRGDLGRYTRKRDIQALMNAVNEAQTMYAMMCAVDKALMTINDLRLRKEKARMNNLLKLRIVLNETNLDPLIFMENIMKSGKSTVSAVRRLMDNYWRGVNASGVDVAKGVDGDTGIVMQFIRDHVYYDKLFGTTGVTAEAIAEYCDRLRKELRGEETGQESLLNTKQINTFSEELRERMEEAVSLIEGYLNVQSELKGMDIYSGVSNAQQEIESIQAEIKKLNEEIKELTDQKVAVTDGRIVDAKKEIEARKKEIQRLNREIASARINNAGVYIGDMPKLIERMYQLNSSLESILKGGRADLSAFNAKKEKRRKELVNMTLEAIDASEEAMSKDYPEYSAWQKIRASGVVHFFTQHLGSMDHMLRRADRNAPNGEGILHNFFMPRLIKAKNAMYTGIMEIADRMSAKTKALFGKEFNSLMRKAEGIILGEISVTHADGKKETYEYTLSNALYTLAIWDQPNGRESLRRQGFTDEHINQLREWLKANDPKWLEFEEWVVNDLLPSIRTKYNKVYREINGVDMDFVDAYFPIRRLDSSIPQSVDIAAPDFENKPSVMTGAIIKRTNNKLPIDVRTSFFGALQDHVKEMEEWAAMAPIIQDFNMILSNPKVRKAMDAVDERFFKDFSDAAKVATLNYTGDKRKLDNLFWQMALRTWASRLLGFKAFTALKQLTSSVLFMPYSANPKYMGRLIWYYLGFGGKGTLTDAMFEKIGLGNLVVKSEGEPWFNIKWAMENSPMFRRRWESGVAGNDIFQRELKYNERTWWGRLVRRAGEIIDDVQHLAMSPIALVDAYTVAAGMRAIYDFEMTNLLKQGYSETEARRIAMLRAEVAANKTQQSSESEYLAPIQKNGGFISAFTIFQNAPFAQGRMIAEAWNELTRDYKKEIEFIYKQELARIKRENAAEIEAVEATIAKEKEAGVITNTEEENIRRAQLMKPINERMEREAQANADKRENKAKLKATRTLIYNAFFGQAIFNLAGQLPYLLFGDDDEKKRKIREELTWLMLFAPMGTVVGGGQLMSILGGHKVEFSGALTELQDGINDIVETAQKEGIFDAMLVAGDFLVKKGLGLDLDSFYKVYSGIENMFEDGMSAEAMLLALNGPESQVRLLAGDRKEGETVEEYVTRNMRLYTIFSDPEYSDYYNTKVSFIGDEPAGRMTKKQMREMRKQYDQAYRSDVMRNKGRKDEWKEFVELEEKYAEAMEHLFKSSKPRRNSGYVDGKYHAPIDGLSEEDFSTLKYLALYATETMKYAENYIGQDEDTYLELVRAEAEAKREFMEEYNKIIDK